MLSYITTPHSTTNETLSELFLKRKLRTRLDLLKPDVHKSVSVEQTKQKNNYDRRCRSREYFVGQNIQAHNFRAGPRWVAGMIVERLGPLTNLVQVDSGVFWRRHIDQLRSAHDKPVEQSTTVPTNTSLSPDVPSPNQTDFVPIVETEHSEPSPVVEHRTNQPVTE